MKALILFTTLFIVLVLLAAFWYIFLFYKKPLDEEAANSLVHAVMHRDAERVALLINQGADLEERNYRGSTPLRIALGSDQMIIAEMLVNAGADVFTMDSLYITAAGALEDSRLRPDVPEGEAMLRLRKIFEEKGVIFPVPSPQEMPQALENGTWPNHATPPPLKTS